MKQVRGQIVELDRRPTIEIDGVYYIIGNMPEVGSIIFGDIVLVEYDPEDQFCTVKVPQLVYQVLSEDGNDAGNDRHMGIFNCRVNAEEWLSELKEYCPGETFTIVKKELT